MTTFSDLEQFKAFSNHLVDAGEAVPMDNRAPDLRGPAYQKAFERLQRTQADFARDSSNLAKLDLMLDAMDRYQTANEMLRIKLHTSLLRLSAEKLDHD